MELSFDWYREWRVAIACRFQSFKTRKEGFSELSQIDLGSQEVEGDIDILGNGDLPWGSVGLVEKETEGFNWVNLELSTYCSVAYQVPN
jgi:hypothetical protein